MRAAAVDVGSAVHQLDRVRSDYDGFAAERSLAELGSCYRCSGQSEQITRSAGA
jgi:hypothetical protein